VTTNTTETNLVHEYSIPGTFTVSLVVTGPLGVSTNSKADYVAVATLPLADIAVVQSDAPDPVTATNALIYTISVTNAGPDDADNVVISNERPDGVSPSGTYVTNLGTLASGASTSITISVEVNANTTGTITNRAGASSDGIDTNLSDNLSTEATTVSDFDGDADPDFNDQDDDNDAIPDSFESLHGLNSINAADAGEDGDLDGFSNLQEYVADTDPTNAASFHRVTGIEMQLPTVIYFPSSTGRTYFLQFSTNLPLGDWIDIGSNFPGNGGTSSATDTNMDEMRHYRIGVEAP